MIGRAIEIDLEKALARQVAVALIGPRQVGKTTLAHAVGAGRPSLYLDFPLIVDWMSSACPYC